MRLDSNFEERAHALPIVVDQAPPRTTHLAFGSTQVKNLEFSKGATSPGSRLSFELEYAREHFTSRCESAPGFALVCKIESSTGSEFTLRMQSDAGVHGSIERSGVSIPGPLFELDARRGAVELAGFSVRRGGSEVAAVELPHAVQEPSAWVTGALLEEERGAVLAAFAAIASVRWPGDAAAIADDS